MSPCVIDVAVIANTQNIDRLDESLISFKLPSASTWHKTYSANGFGKRAKHVKYFESRRARTKMRSDFGDVGSVACASLCVVNVLSFTCSF